MTKQRVALIAIVALFVACVGFIAFCAEQYAAVAGGI